MADVKVLIAPVEPPALRPEQLRDIALRNTNVTGLLGQVDRKRVVVHGPDVLGRKADARAPFSATLFDPLSNRAVGLTGRLGTPDRLETRPVAFAPVPAPDELRRAAAVLRADRRSAPFADRRGVIVYQPMPPLADLERPDGTVARRPTLGIFDPQRRPRHRIVAVDLARRVVDWEPHVHLVPDADCEEASRSGSRASPTRAGTRRCACGWSPAAKSLAPASRLLAVRLHIAGAANDGVEQLGPVFPNRPSWSPIRQETSRKRTILARGWRVRDKTNGHGYRIVKGLLDGTADAYGVSDLWFLRYHANELEDGVTLVSGSAAQTQAHINHFVNGEIIDGTDVVVWYAGHFVHDEMAPEPHAGHIIGPELRPFNWP